MPTYLLHGFRWTRVNIRIHIILHDLEDAASEWIMAPATSVSLLEHFYEKFDFIPHPNLPSSPCSPLFNIPTPPFPDDTPADTSLDASRTNGGKNSCTSLRSHVRKSKPVPKESQNEQQGRNYTDVISRLPAQPYSYVKTPIHFNEWSPVKLIEQYDPHEQYMCSQPYAFVADYIVKIDLSVGVEEEMRKYDIIRTEQYPHQENKDSHDYEVDMGMKSSSKSIPKSRHWFEKLCNELEKDGEIGWFIVHCGDQEREVPTLAVKKSSRGSDSKILPKTPWSDVLKFHFFKGRRNEADK